MTDQFDLLSQQPLVRATDRDTSRSAAALIEPHVRALQLDVFAVFVDRGPMTAAQAEVLPEFKPKYKPSTIRKRISELFQGGYLKETGVVIEGCHEYRAADAIELGLLLERKRRERGAS